MPRDRNRAAWEDWGRVDPYWAILAWPEARHGRWDVDEFFATGVEWVASVLADARRLGRPVRHGTAVDFGCGVGRLTRALAPHFERTYGLDVASTMIEQARRLDAQRGASGAEFVLHDHDDLSRVASGSVDFVLCLLVLQHLPARAAIEVYLREFVRVLAPGGVAVVQLPVHVPGAGPPGPVPLRVRATGWLRAAGVRPAFLYERLGWQPEMPMSGIPYEETVAIFESAGGQLLEALPETSDPGGVVSRVYYVGPA
jgi:ubiquinone/menaquinone biosynthesis C-methylase UbiE